MRLSRNRPAPDRRPADVELAALLDSAAGLAEAVNRSAQLAQQRFGLSGAQLFVLRLLAEAPAQSLNDLAARAGTHQSTVSVVVNRLVVRGLVARSASAADGRRVILALTRTGRALARRVPEPVYARLTEAFRRLPQRERRLVARALARVVGELTGGESTGGVLAEPPLRPRIARRERRRH
jgi:DNA-binding MarR family transcriptional regulator